MLKEQMLQSLYDVVITTEIFDKIKLFGIGDKIIANKKQRNLAAVQLELEQFIKSQIADLDKTDSLILTTLIKNQSKSIVGQSAYSNKATATLDKFMRLSGATVAKKMLDLRGIIGIQPMNGPVGQVYQLVYTSDNTTNDDESRSLRLEVLPSIVEAVSRQLQAQWNIEGTQDLSLFIGVDNVEKEIMAILSTEIIEEITQQVISELQLLASYHEIRTIKRDSDRAQHAIRFLCSINQEANRIAADTLRGTGNYIICHPSSLSNVIQNILAANMGFELTKTHLDNPECHSFHHAGTITGFEQVKRYDVYVSNRMPEHEDKDTILIGYKGGSGELDTGYILAPYVPILSTGVCIDSFTFTPLMKLMTRYGRFVYINPTDGEKPLPFAEEKTPRMHDSTKYYRMIEIEHFDI